MPFAVQVIVAHSHDRFVQRSEGVCKYVDNEKEKTQKMAFTYLFGIIRNIRRFARTESDARGK